MTPQSKDTAARALAGWAVAVPAAYYVGKRWGFWPGVGAWLLGGVVAGQLATVVMGPPPKT